jgi:hypothetical protein
MANLPLLRLTLLVLLAGAAVCPEALAQRVTPDLRLTPGKVRSLTRSQVCSTRWGHDPRRVTLQMKKQVAAAYAVPWADHAKYEFDHLVPRELGGADDVLNLWPEPLDGSSNAHDKDRLENALHREVCERGMPLKRAQDIFMKDWTLAMAMYVPIRRAPVSRAGGLRR